MHRQHSDYLFSTAVFRVSLRSNVGLDCVVILVHYGREEELQQSHGRPTQFVPGIDQSAIQGTPLQDPVQNTLELVEEVLLTEATMRIIEFLELLNLNEQGQ